MLRFSIRGSAGHATGVSFGQGNAQSEHKEGRQMADGTTAPKLAPGEASPLAFTTPEFTPEVDAATAPIWEKVKSRVTPIEWRLQAPLIAEINRLKREK